MGFSTPTTVMAADQTASASTPKGPSFGDRLMDYFQKRYPVAGGLANMVFQDQQQAAPVAQAPQMQMPNYDDLISMNAQPKESGGLEAILKLMSGGA